MVEADESDRSMLALDVEVAVVTNVELDHHATTARWPRCARCSARSSPARRRRSWGPPRRRRPARRTRRAWPSTCPTPTLEARGSRFAWRGLEVAPARPRRAQRAQRGGGAGGAARSRAPTRRGRGGAGRLRRRRAGASSASATTHRGRARRRRLRPPPDRGRGDDRGRPHAAARGASSPSSSPTCTRAPQRLAREFGAALARADVVAVLDVYPARERAEDFPGVTGLPSPRRPPTPPAGARSCGCRPSTTPSAAGAASCATATSASCSARATSTRWPPPRRPAG